MTQIEAVAKKEQNMTEILLIGFGITAVAGVGFFAVKSKRNISYALLTTSFFLLGCASFLEGRTEGIAAFLLAIIASRNFHTKFDRK